MAVTLGNNTVTFPDGSVQTTAYTTGADKGQLISITTYSSGVSTYTAPANCRYVWVKLQGAGGGSAGYCESGGSGGYAEKRITLAAGTTVTVTVGAGGAGVGYYAAGGNGGTSSFGTYVSATGGYGSNTLNNHTGGRRGIGSGGDVNLTGGGGTGHANHHGSGGMGRGGAGFYGSGNGVRHYYNTFVPCSAPGAGAAGGITDSGGSGSTGAAGLVQVYAYT